MRYIKKTTEPACMTTWKELRKTAEQPLAYDDFDKKKELNEYLPTEQHHICCYCQQRIEHFQGNKIGGAHNEHLIPENGPNGDFDKQMDYQNLYACCIDSQGLKKKEKSKRHCGEAKEEKLIRGFIQEEGCNGFFRYNTLGEIIPNGSYDQWQEYLVHKDELTVDLKDATDAINTLNLNCHFLVEDRKGDLDKLLLLLNGFSKDQVQEKMIEFEQSETFLRYVDMLFYFMKQKK